MPTFWKNMTEKQWKITLENKLNSLHSYLNGKGNRFDLELKALEDCLETHEDKIEPEKSNNVFF